MTLLVVAPDLNSPHPFLQILTMADNKHLIEYSQPSSLIPVLPTHSNCIPIVHLTSAPLFFSNTLNFLEEIPIEGH